MKQKRCPLRFECQPFEQKFFLCSLYGEVGVGCTCDVHLGVFPMDTNLVLGLLLVERDLYRVDDIL